MFRAVGLVGMSVTNQNGELAACAGGDNLFAPDGGVVNDSGNLDVINGALTRLIVCGEAPGVDLALRSDGKIIVGACGDLGDILNSCKGITLVACPLRDRASENQGQ